MNQKVRTGVDGKMKVDNATGLLPFEEDGIELAAIKENWWTGLSVMHNIVRSDYTTLVHSRCSLLIQPFLVLFQFVREHNYIADMLKKKHPDWTDQKLFDIARLINSATVARIHLLEWTMAILGQEAFDINSPLADFAFGQKKNLDGVPFSLTEEFVSVYRYMLLFTL